MALNTVQTQSGEVGIQRTFNIGPGTYGSNRGTCMDSNTMKKAGVVAIILLLALYLTGLVILMVLEVDIAAAVLYGVIGLVFILWLSYEGYQRFKEIDEGLEDAVNDY